MNREEAIEELKTRYLTMSQCLDKEELHKANKAIDMAIKALEQEPCEDVISRTEAIRVASGYCHWSNIPDELAKLPSVNPIPCEDAISRQAVIDGLASIAKAKARSDAQKSMMGRTMFFVERLPSSSTEKTGRWIDRFPLKECKCSECDYLIMLSFGSFSEVVKQMKYCPNCGAKMVEPQESEVQE